MLRKLWRIVPAALAAQGAGMVWLARYGALWRYTDGGWFQPYVLRPGMVAIGLGALVYGLWRATVSGTVAADTLRDAVDTRLAHYAPRLWTWLHRAEIARGDWLPGDECDSRSPCRACYRPIGEHEPGEYDDECLFFVPQSLYNERPRFASDHYPGLIPTPMEGCDCAGCEHLRALASPLSEEE